MRDGVGFCLPHDATGGARAAPAPSRSARRHGGRVRSTPATPLRRAARGITSTAFKIANRPRASKTQLRAAPAANCTLTFAHSADARSTDERACGRGVRDTQTWRRAQRTKSGATSARRAPAGGEREGARAAWRGARVSVRLPGMATRERAPRRAARATHPSRGARPLAKPGGCTARAGRLDRGESASVGERHRKPLTCDLFHMGR